MDRGTLTPLTTEGASDPIWSPDGEWIALWLRDAKNPGIYRRRSDFSGTTEPILLNTRATPEDFSPDGKWLVYREGTSATRESGLWAFPMDGTTEPHSLSQGQYARLSTLSPDGHYLAYASGQDAEPEVFITTFPVPQQRWQISTAGGSEPVWSADGAKLFYREQDRGIMEVELLSESPGLRTTTPKLVMEAYRVDGPERHYDVTPDGRFIIVRDTNTESGRIYFAIILNWFEELERLAPTGS